MPMLSYRLLSYLKPFGTPRFRPLFVGLALLFVLGLSGCETLQTPAEPLVKPLQSAPIPAQTAERTQLARLDTGSGFGGTGHSAALDSGFGGTGRTSSGFGGTGVVGVITDFGSIWVNGIEVGLGQQTRVLSNVSKQVLQVSDLYVGQQVWFETHPNQRATTTDTVHIFYPIAGKVLAIKPLKSKTLLVIGEHSVWVDDKTRFTMPDGVQVGDYVMVSGTPNLSRTTPNSWTATLLTLNPGKITHYQSEPALHFSAKVKRLVLQTPWLYLQQTQKGVLDKLGEVPASLDGTTEPKDVDGLKPVRVINSERAIQQGLER